MKYASGICLSLFSTSNYNILESTLVECFLLVFNLYLISINSSFAKVFHQEKRLDALRHKLRQLWQLVAWRLRNNMKRGTKCVVQTINLSNPKTCIRPKVQRLVSANADSSSDPNRASDYQTSRPTAVKVCSWKDIQKKCPPKVKIIEVFKDLIGSPKYLKWWYSFNNTSSNVCESNSKIKKKVLVLMRLKHCSISNKYHNAHTITKRGMRC